MNEEEEHQTSQDDGKHLQKSEPASNLQKPPEEHKNTGVTAALSDSEINKHRLESFKWVTLFNCVCAVERSQGLQITGQLSEHKRASYSESRLENTTTQRNWAETLTRASDPRLNPAAASLTLSARARAHTDEGKLVHALRGGRARARSCTLLRRCDRILPSSDTNS